MTVTILVVEDEQDDVILLRRAIGKTGLSCSIQVASNGPEAIDYLIGHGKFADRTLYPLPALVLLDLKLPLVSGLDVLDWIRSRPDLSNTGVAVLTSSPLLADFNVARQRGVSAYLVKPPAPGTLRNILTRVLAEKNIPWTATNLSSPIDTNRPMI